MKLPCITMLATLLLTGPAAAQLQIAPPATIPSAAPEKQKPKPHTITKKKEAAPAPKPSASPKPTPTPAATVIPAPPTDNSNADLVFGAYQRGQYKTAFDLATVRAQAGDPKAMTMLGELYENGMGIGVARRGVYRCGARRSRGDVRACHAAHFGPRRLARQGRGGQADGVRRQARRAQGGL